MGSDERFAELMRRVADRDPEATARIVAAYTRRLVALARKRLDERVRAKLDPEDILQSVFKSFFARQAQGQFTLDDESSLWALLAEITLRKCGKWNTYFRARKRNVDREVRPEADDEGEVWEAAAGTPPPEEVAMLHETLDHLLRGCGDASRRICAARLQGHSHQDIAELFNVSERTVSRSLKSFRDRLQRLADESGPGP